MSEQPPQNPGPGWTPPGDVPPPPPAPGGQVPPPPPPPPAYGAPATPNPYPAAPPPPAYGAPAYYGGPDAGPPPGRGMAVTAFVLSLIPFVITQIIAIILSIITLKRVGRNEARGKGLAIAALVISILVLIAVVLVAVVGVSENNRLNDNRKKGVGEIKVQALKAGDCLSKLPTDDTILTVKIIPCSKPHVAEVFGDFKIDGGSKPTQASIDNDAESGCADAFQTYIGGSPLNYQIGYIRPSPKTIDELKKVACIVSVPDGKDTGSLKGSGGS